MSPTHPLTATAERAHGAETPAGVRSEAGALRTALVDVSLRDGGRDRCATAVARALGDRGVTVLGLPDLLADAVRATAVRRVLIEQVLATAALAPAVARRAARILAHLDPAAAARALEDGLPARDWDPTRAASPRTRFLLEPMPAARSLRSTAIVVGDAVLPALPPAAMPEARRAVAIVSLLGRVHPALASLRSLRYAADPGLRRSAAQVSGDDVLLAADGSLLVGIGFRTTAHGARQLARTVLDAGLVRHVVVAALPKGARVDRLDRLIGLVGTGLAAVHPSAFDDDVTTWTLEADPRDDGALASGAPQPLRDVLERLTHGARLLELPPDAAPAEYLPVRPGVVLASAPEGVRATALLERAGVEVVPVPDAAGPAGGLRRLVQPVQRDALPTG
ncbi:arginine deiminase family protein [Amnibacterium sp.]|uniref:arginine deiminase family protein n=1 Tax=Amnibacterium sp. TaxID=1872496 RepID=UPI003F7B6C1C